MSLRDDPAVRAALRDRAARIREAAYGRYGFRTDPEGDAARRAAFADRTITPEEWRTIREGEQRPAGAPTPEEHEPVPGHLLTYERTPAGSTIARCECGRWDGGWTGPRSRRRVLDDHACHVATELSAEGPLRIPSVRVDSPKEVEP